jgi:hypothetical protein
MKFTALVSAAAALLQCAQAAPDVNSTDVKLSTCQITEYILALQDDCGWESIHGKNRP